MARSDRGFETYSASGKGPLLRTCLLAVPCSVSLALLAGWTYQCVVLRDLSRDGGSVALSALLSVLLTAATVAPIWLIARWLRCRSALLLFGIGAIAGTAMCAASWGAAIREAEIRGIHWTETPVELPSFTTGETDKWRQEMRREDEKVNRLMKEARRELAGGQTQDPAKKPIETDAPRPRPVEARAKPAHAGRGSARIASLREYLEFRWRHGWPDRSWDSSGYFAGAVWTSEWLAMMLGIGLLARQHPFRYPYCERHQLWTKRVLALGVEGLDCRHMMEAAAAGDLDDLLSLRVDPSRPERAQFFLLKCPRCEFGYLTVLGWRTRAIPGKDLKRVRILKNVRIEARHIESLMRLAGKGPRTEIEPLPDLGPPGREARRGGE